MSEGNPEAAPEGLGVKYYLRDINKDMVSAWEDKDAFGGDRFKDVVEVRLMKP